jgi:hypothetical protein
MSSRALAFALAASVSLCGCGDDTTSGAHDMSMHVPGADLASNVDIASCGGSFTGFSAPTPLTFYDCSCGCTVDTFMHPDILPMWGVSRTGSGLPVGTSDGLQSILEVTPSSPVAVIGLLSQTQLGGFFLDGDFDLLVDWSFGGTSPPGESHLILGVRKPAVVVGTDIFDIERAHLADGSDIYRSQLGGVPPGDNATTTTSGTMELARRGLTTTAYVDGKVIGSFLAASGPRMEITLSSALSGCEDQDGGSCSYSPLWISLRLKSGTLVNQP